MYFYLYITVIYRTVLIWCYTRAIVCVRPNSLLNLRKKLINSPVIFVLVFY